METRGILITLFAGACTHMHANECVFIKKKKKHLKSIQYVSDCAGAHGCVCISYRVEVWLQAANGISKRQVNRFKTSSPTPEQPPCSQPLPPAVYITSLQTIKPIMQVFVSAFLTVVQTPQNETFNFLPQPLIHFVVQLGKFFLAQKVLQTPGY